MKPGLYEARSLIVDRTAFVLLDDASDLRLQLHRARAALQVIKCRGGHSGHDAAWALRDIEEG